MASTSAPRRFNRYRRPQPPPFVPTPPSAEYLALSEIPSRRISPDDDDAPTPRKLLVLDLNGTLVLRSPRTYNAPRTVMARPYSKTFRKYVFREGSHLDVMVWSSAQPHSVNSMLDVFFESDRKHLVGIWARDTLGLAAENYSQKVQTIKDLNTIWNAPAGLPPPVKITPPPPMAVLTNDPSTIPGYDPSKPAPDIGAMIHTSMQLMPPRSPVGDAVEVDRTGYFETPEVRIDDPIPGLSNGEPKGDVVAPTSSGLYSALNTLLLDDSALKAHLQPHNHLTLPEYTADLRSRDVRRRAALDEMLGLGEDDSSSAHDGALDEDKVEEGVEVGSGKKAKAKRRRAAKPDIKAMRAAPFDKTLIAVIGVLNAVQHESSIIGWIKAGGLRPTVEEMARVAAQVEEHKDDGDVTPEDDDSVQVEDADAIEVEDAEPAQVEGGQAAEDGEAAGTLRSSKRSSSVMSGQGGRSRKRTNTGPDTSTEDTSLDGANVTVETSGDVGQSDLSFVPSEVSVVVGSDEQAEIVPSSTPPTSTSGPTDDTPAPTKQLTNRAKRKQKHHRQKPTYPVTHPLSADDSYPFFFNANPKAGSGLWFQDREVYAYWVRRGLLALQECGIEPEDGVVDS